MSNIKTIRNKIKIMQECNTVCTSMSNLSIIKMASAKQMVVILEKNLKKLGNILYLKGLSKKFNQQLNYNFVYFSDFGFCGGFNNHCIDESIIGKQAKTPEMIKYNNILIGEKSNSDVKTSDINIFSNFIMNRFTETNNLSFTINHSFKNKVIKINIINFIKDFELIGKEILVEIEPDNLLQVFYKLFTKYMFYVGSYHENSFRTKLMKNASDRTHDIIYEEKINLSKINQMNVTNEIMLIVSGNGGFGD